MSTDRPDMVEENEAKIQLSDGDMAKLLFAAREGTGGEISDEQETALVLWAERVLRQAEQVAVILNGTMVPTGTCDGCGEVVVVPVEEMFGDEDIVTYQMDLAECCED